jgi:hypothetical protein
MARGLRDSLRLASLPTGSLRVLLVTYAVLDVLPRERAAITYELAMRSWADFIEERLYRTIGWCRGGRS